MTTCTMFATYTAYLSKNLIAADPDLCTSSSSTTSSLQPTAAPSSSSSLPTAATTTATTAATTSYDPARLDKLSDNLQKYEDNFSRHLKILLDALNYYAATETVVLLGLCARLSTASEGTGGLSGGSGGGELGGTF